MPACLYVCVCKYACMHACAYACLYVGMCVLMYLFTIYVIPRVYGVENLVRK
jgi:hypothetical protein